MCKNACFFENTKIWDAAKSLHLFFSGLPILIRDTESNPLKQKTKQKKKKKKKKKERKKRKTKKTTKN